MVRNKLLKIKNSPLSKSRRISAITVSGRISSDTNKSKQSCPVQSNKLIDVSQPHTSPESYNLPAGYGEDSIVLMIRDPWWLYAYWEVQPETERLIRGRLLPKEIAGLRTILRVRDVTQKDSAKNSINRPFDIEVTDMATSRYINIDSPGRSFIVELGFLTRSKKFLVLVRSNQVTSPQYGISDLVDEKWNVDDKRFRKLIQMSTGLNDPTDPSRLKEWLKRRPASGAASTQGVFSPGVMQSSKKLQEDQEFWLQVDAEVVIYGRTHPLAAVTIGDYPVTLRSDGTFSLRVALPDGLQEFPVVAISPDGVKKQSITHTVKLKTRVKSKDRRLIAKIPK